MVFENPKVEFVPIDLSEDISCVSRCTDDAQKAALETCTCSDGVYDVATGNDEDCLCNGDEDNLMVGGEVF